MKLASRASGHPDGELLVVSQDLATCAPARAASTLQQAIDGWDSVEDELEQQYRALNRGEARDAVPVSEVELLAAMPRSYQFLDGSAFLAHNHILAQAWRFEPRNALDPPLMYQGLSDRFLPPAADVTFRSATDDIDFEAEFAIITDRVPLGVTPQQARSHIKLVLLLNDWSLRAFGPAEMKGGFGFIHAKPPRAMSAFAISPTTLAEGWHQARVQLSTRILVNDRPFGHPHGSEMSYGFDELIAHAATTRDLCAGTVLGSGTVSSHDYERVGSGCIAERRAIDTIRGAALTPYLQFGDRVRIDAVDAAGRSVFGPIEQRITQRGVS